MARATYLPSIRVLNSLPDSAEVGEAYYVQSVTAIVAWRGSYWSYVTGPNAGNAAWPASTLALGVADLDGSGNAVASGSPYGVSSVTLQGAGVLDAAGWRWGAGVADLLGGSDLSAEALPTAGGGAERYSALGDVNFDRLDLDDTEQDQNGLTLRDWYDQLLLAGTAGTYDSEFDSPDNRQANRQGSMYVGSLLMGLRLLGDLQLLDEAVRLTELKYAYLTTDGNGYLYLPDTQGEDQPLDTNLMTGVFARVAIACHANDGVTSPAGYDYGAIASKYKDYITDHFFPREMLRNGPLTDQSPPTPTPLYDYIGWRHDGGAIFMALHLIQKMGGGGGGFTEAQWQDAYDWFSDYYFMEEASCNTGYGGRATRIMKFTIYTISSNPNSYAIIYTTYVRYVLSFMKELWAEGAAPTHLTETWFTQVANSLADFVIDTTFSTNDMARTLAGDDPTEAEKCGFYYNGTYRDRITGADERWQDAAYCYMEMWDSRGRLEDWGIEAWGRVGSYRDTEPNYACSRILMKLFRGSWDMDAASSTVTGTYTEDTVTDMNNPDRGWYTENMYFGNTIGQCNYSGNNLVDDLPNFDPNDLRLELLYYDLQAYVDASIPQSFLDAMSTDFSQLRAAGKKCILRFAYERNDYNTDEDVAGITAHWTTLKPVVEANQDVISVLQGGFVGPWGEQWIRSNYTQVDTAGERADFVDLLMNNTPATMQVQWRQPFWFTESSEPTATYADRFDGSRAQRLGHYNDCIGAGESMAYTYNAQSDWDWAYAQGPYTAMGGETCNSNGYDTQWDVPSYLFPVLANLGIDYMNAEYYIEMKNNWTNYTYEGEDALEWFSKHMGYRLVLDSFSITSTMTPGGSITISMDLRNVGMGKVFNRRAVEVVFVSQVDGDVVTLNVTNDARTKLPLSGENVTAEWTVNAPSSLVPTETYAVYLRLPDPNASIRSNPDYAIRLANSDLSWDASTGRHNLGLNVSVT